MELKINGQIWIEGNNGFMMGIGKYKLLKEIQNTYSLKKAALELNISYRKAWAMVDKMNETNGTELVKRLAGGKNGGYSIITDEGIKTIQIFEKKWNLFQKFLEKNNK